MPLSYENRLQIVISAYKNKTNSLLNLKLLRYLEFLEIHFKIDYAVSIHEKETRANSHKLTRFEEESLLKQLLDADKRGFSIRPEFLRGMAEILLRNRRQDSTASLGINWSYKFVKRHPELHTRYTRRITYQRAKQEDPKVINP